MSMAIAVVNEILVHREMKISFVLLNVVVDGLKNERK